MPKNSAFCKTSSLIVQLPGKLIRLFLARDVWVPRSVTSPYFALTGQEGNHAMALRPNAYHGGSLGGPRSARPFVRACGAHPQPLYHTCGGQIAQRVVPPLGRAVNWAETPAFIVLCGHYTIFPTSFPPRQSILGYWKLSDRRERSAVYVKA